MTRRLIVDTIELIPSKLVEAEGLDALAETVGVHRDFILKAVLLFLLYGKAEELVSLNVYREMGESGVVKKIGPIIEQWASDHAAKLVELFAPLLEIKGMILTDLTVDKRFVLVQTNPAPLQRPPIVILRNSMSVADMTVRAKNAIGANINLAVPWYLSASFAYYKEDVSLLTDTYYDDICTLLNERWDEVTHRHKSLIERDALSAGTGYHLKYDKWPSILQSATRQLMSELNTL